MSTQKPSDHLEATAIEALAHQIAQAHDRLGHRLGWLGLYTPARTLSPTTRLAFVGLNPGGSRWEPSRASCEQGNAYRVEGWAPDGSHNRLQEQVGLLYDGLAARLGADAATLMDEQTMALNFCPFRSGSWATLVRPQESVAFSRGMWDEVLSTCRPSIMLCLGDLAYREIGQALVRAGARPGEEETTPVGWGKVTMASTLHAFAGGHTLLVRLPHLSRFSIVGRAASQPAVDGLLDLAAGVMGGPAPRIDA